VPHHKAGTAKLLFVTNRERSPQAPEVPTASEAGYPGLTFDGVGGIYGWRDMSAELKQRIAADIAGIIADPAFRARVESVGTVLRSGTPEQFAAAIAEQRAKISAIHQATQTNPR
jgi:tripartite-type tricarboxylate transporter receptor subunit TctC